MRAFNKMARYEVSAKIPYQAPKGGGGGVCVCVRRDTCVNVHVNMKNMATRSKIN